MFTFNPKQQLKVESDSDMLPAMLQLEYLAATDGKMKTMCATQCLHRMHEEELSNLEQQCLAQCSQKLSVFFGSYFAQQAAIQRQVSAQRNTDAQGRQ